MQFGPECLEDLGNILILTRCFFLLSLLRFLKKFKFGLDPLSPAMRDLVGEGGDLN